MPKNTPCPCGNSENYEFCCNPYLECGKLAPTAEALMRSRYSAFVLGNAAYLLNSWHPDTAPKELTMETSPGWCALEVLTTEGGLENDDTGVVEFKAHYMSQGKSFTMHEVSRFARNEGRWLYVDSDPQKSQGDRERKVERNEPCPCGSGKKFKKCCLR